MQKNNNMADPFNLETAEVSTVERIKRPVANARLLISH